MGWDWVKILKEEMLDLKSDEHLSRHAATDRLAWVSSQAPARAPLPADDWPEHPGTPPRGSALLGYDDEIDLRPGRASGASGGLDAASGLDAAAGVGPGRGSDPVSGFSSDPGFNSDSGFNSGPLYGGANASAADHAGPAAHVGAHRRHAEGERPSFDDFDFAMPTDPPLEYPAPGGYPGGFSSPNPGASLPRPAAAAGLPPVVGGFAPGAPGGVPAPAEPHGARHASAPSHPDLSSHPDLASHPDLSARADLPGLSQAEISQAAQVFGQPPGFEYGQDDAADQGHVLTLIIDGALAGVALPTGAEVTVGRERQCSLVVPEAKQTVSRRAVTLVRSGRRSVEARIENRNGAWVTRHLPEGTRQEFIERGNSVTLRTGDRLSLDPPGTVVVGLGEPH